MALNKNTTGTGKVFNTSELTDSQIKEEVFKYAEQLGGGGKLKPTADPNVFYTKLDDGTTINVRSVSSSTLADGTKPRWTVDVVNEKFKSLVGDRKVELKFK